MNELFLNNRYILDELNCETKICIEILLNSNPDNFKSNSKKLLDYIPYIQLNIDDLKRISERYGLVLYDRIDFINKKRNELEKRFVNMKRGFDMLPLGFPDEILDMFEGETKENLKYYDALNSLIELSDFLNF